MSMGLTRVTGEAFGFWVKPEENLIPNVNHLYSNLMRTWRVLDVVQ